MRDSSDSEDRDSDSDKSEDNDVTDNTDNGVKTTNVKEEEEPTNCISQKKDLPESKYEDEKFTDPSKATCEDQQSEDNSEDIVNIEENQSNIEADKTNEWINLVLFEKERQVLIFFMISDAVISDSVNFEILVSKCYNLTVSIFTIEI